MKRAMTKAIVFATGLALAAGVLADQLEWTLPSETVNGEPLAPDEITAVTVYRAGEPLAGLPGTATTFDIPSCRAAVYTVTATAGEFESAHSNEAGVVPLEHKCRPKPPSVVVR